MMVAQLINQVTFKWDSSIINGLIPAPLNQSIKDIQIRRSSTDEIIWASHNKGCFSVKTAYLQDEYHVESSSSGSLDRETLKTIWT
ncbi:hypothetical protein FRX31_014933 [Thalictrum thalictroides]|uniref:Uncharacterized protein n=1 Tax=Thalictrum thalictroides TaxID=46969 RepID=A0A7J6WDS5_THATH|nr:hypothetical protein FRX31_014933 [Thalictrum thalictroides]